MPLNWSQLPEIAAAGRAIREPAETPSEWTDLKPQSVTKAVLREFGLG